MNCPNYSVCGKTYNPELKVCTSCFWRFKNQVLDFFDDTCQICSTHGECVRFRKCEHFVCIKCHSIHTKCPLCKIKTCWYYKWQSSLWSAPTETSVVTDTSMWRTRPSSRVTGHSRVSSGWVNHHSDCFAVSTHSWFCLKIRTKNFRESFGKIEIG